MYVRAGLWIHPATECCDAEGAGYTPLPTYYKEEKGNERNTGTVLY